MVSIISCYLLKYFWLIRDADFLAKYARVIMYRFTSRNRRMSYILQINCDVSSHQNMALSTICRIARNNNSINKVDLYCNGIWRRMRSPNLTTSSINERNFVATNPRFKCPERNSVDSTKAHVDDQVGLPFVVKYAPRIS